MAKGIQDLGTGLGYLYKTKPDGTTIVAVEKNTADGVRSMKIAGTNNGPIIAQRPAVATITVNSVASVGSITAITIAGVNQIGSNIVVTSSTASVVAAQIATAINRYTPTTGIGDFTAQAIGAVVYVYSEPATGSLSNGETITISATDPSINTSTTDFTNGSSEGGIYDSTFGYRFYIDADYNGTASPSVLTYALEITEYMTVRGLQSGIISDTKTISSDAITGLTRSCAITQIFVFNQGGAASDVLAYLQVEGFAEGDEVRLSAGDPGAQIPTIEDARSTTSPVSSPNIYLTDQTPFVMDSFGSLTLQLKNYPSTGLVWVETGRSTANSVITTTIAGLSSLSSSSSLRPNSLYYISDLGDAGTYVTADTTKNIQSIGYHFRRVPIGYATCWASDMTAPAVGLRVRYYQGVYQSVTGAVGTAPDTDTVNWTFIVKTNNTYYETQVNTVGLNSIALLSSWPFVWERDNKNNLVSQSEPHSILTTTNAYTSFAWRRLADTAVYGNTVIDAIFDCANSNGQVYGNLVYGNANFANNKLRSTSIVALNTFHSGGVITGNYVDVYYANTVDGGQIINNGGAGNYFYQIGNNNVMGIISSNTSATNGNKSIEHCTIDYSGSISSNTFYQISRVRYCKIGVGSTLTGSVFRNTGTYNLDGATVENYGSLTITETTTALNGYITVDNSTVTLNINGSSVANTRIKDSTVTWTVDASSAFNDISESTLSFTGRLNNMVINGRSTTGSPTLTLGSGEVTRKYSTITATLDLDDAGVWSAGVLTIPSNEQFAGVFQLTSTANRNTTQVVNVPADWEVLFIPIDPFNFTFTTTARATVAGNQIAGASASYVLTVTGATSAYDQLWMILGLGGFPIVTRATILI